MRTIRVPGAARSIAQSAAAPAGPPPITITSAVRGISVGEGFDRNLEVVVIVSSVGYRITVKNYPIFEVQRSGLGQFVI
jgi:hypothetical protein